MVIAVARSSEAPGGDPPRVGHADIYRESTRCCAITIVDRGHDFAVADDLHLVDGLHRVPIYNHGHTGGVCAQLQYFIARLVVSHHQSQNGPVGDETTATPQAVEPPIVGKIRANVDVYPVT